VALPPLGTAQKRLLVFDWDDGWNLATEVELFENPPEGVYEALWLLEPAALTSQRNL